MEPALLGLVLDSSAVIAAERKKQSIPEFIEAIFGAHGQLDLSLSPVTVAELVHGIYRSKTPETGRRRRQFIEELVSLVPVHPVTSQTGWLVGQIEGQEAAKGNVLPFNDLMIAAAAIEQGYAVLTGNVRHFQKIPGLTVVPF
jgi:predicted nucleic acid-binding protein